MVLLTLGTILLVQAATVVTITYYRHRYSQHSAVKFTATTIRILRASLAKVPADQRADFVRASSQNQWHLWTQILPADTYIEGQSPLHRPHHRGGRADNTQHLHRFVRELNTELNDGTRVALSRGADPQLFISLLPDPDSDIDDNLIRREWLVIPVHRITAPVSTPAIIAWLAGMILFLLLAALFSWHITRPLTRLAKAADQLAAGKPQRVVPSGPIETRALGERFNAMLDSLAESSAVRRTLLAGLPHDLKGPLSRMWLRIEMASDATFQEGMRKDIQDMQRMIDQFIGFVRGTDPGTYRFKPLLFNDWLDEQIGAWESTGDSVRQVRHDARPMTIKADRAALTRLFDNLITNALNHGKPPVEVALRSEPGFAVATVRDHGPGIPEARRAEALRPFSRLDDARTRTGSVGLGLALADAIARAHGGSLELGDAAGGGLEITLRFPLAENPGQPLA
jgi:two-component system osmolarity sensor histidine kinase EnvZ